MHFPIKTVVIFIFLLSTSKANGIVELGTSTNFILAGINNANLKLQTHILLHLGRVALGPVVRYQHFNTEMQESIVALGFRIDTPVYIQLEAGVLEREAFGLKGSGTAATFTIGSRISEHVFLEMPIIYRNIPDSEEDNTLNGRTQIDLVPMFGVSIGG